MREFRKANTTWELCVGSVLAVIGIVLIGLAGWKTLDLWISTTIYVAGSIACLGGFFLIWKDLLEAACIRYIVNEGLIEDLWLSQKFRNRAR